MGVPAQSRSFKREGNRVIMTQKLRVCCGVAVLLLACAIHAKETFPLDDESSNQRSLYEMQSQLYEQTLGNQKSGFSIKSAKPKSLYEKESALYSQALADESEVPSEVLIQDPAFTSVLTGESMQDPDFHSALSAGASAVQDPAFANQGEILAQVTAFTDSVPDMIFGGRPDPAFNQAGHNDDPPESHEDPAFAGSDSLVQEKGNNPDTIFGTHNDPAFVSHPAANGESTGVVNDPEFPPSSNSLVQEKGNNP